MAKQQKKLVKTKHFLQRKEFAKAMAMVVAAKKRLASIFYSISEECSHRKQGNERIGFEGFKWMECTCKEHVHAGTLYPTCKAMLCPIAKRDLTIERK